MGKHPGRPVRLAVISLGVTAVILAATAAALVSLNRAARQASAGPPPAAPLPSVSAPPGISPQGWPGTPPAAACAHPVPLRRATGAWLLGYNDDSRAASPIPAAAGQFSLLDFDWLSFTSPAGLARADRFAPPLASVLGAAARANPCALRFVTVNDSSATAAVLAQILTRPAAMRAHVAALAGLMAGQPDAAGLTLDYEFALPRTEAELAGYARVAGWHGLSAGQEVSLLTDDYTRLVQMTALAMHRQHRLLRVACLVRDNDMVASEPGNIAPYLLDYGQLARYADQLVLMAVDFHYSTGSPGPIAPLADVRQVAGYVRSYGMPLAKLAVEVPDYAYDWQVNAEGDIATAASGQAIPARSLTPTQLAAAMRSGRWQRLGARDGEVEYGYAATVSGRKVRHIVWDAAAALSYKKRQLGKELPGVPVNIWQIGNNDPVGTALAVRVK